MTMRLPAPISLLLFIAASTTVSAMPNVFARQDTCAASGLRSCSQGLPDNFCCPETSRCISLAGATSALCCPEGKDCQRIKPIICDASAQDAAKFPGAPIKTTIFDVPLSKCGDDGCCPFGYSCAGTECLRDEDQSKPPKDTEGSKPPSSTATTEPSSTKTGGPTLIITNPGDATSAPAEAVVPSNGSSSGPTTGAIIGGVVGGCVFLFLVAAIIFICVRRKNKHQPTFTEKGIHRKNSQARHSMPFASIISDPILQPNNCVRTDFILKEPSLHSSAESNANSNSYSNRSGGGPPPRHINVPRISIPNPFDSPNPSEPSPAASRASYLSQDDRPLRTGNVGAARLAPIRAMKSSDRRSRCLTPPNFLREPSSESINVFADPGTVGKNKENRLTRATTFTDLMDQAELGDVHRGKPYVPGSTPRI